MKPIKKFLFKLAMYDGVWSLPLAILAFWFIGMAFQSYFGLAAGSYDIAFFQPLFLAIGIVIGAANAAVAGLWFGFRGLFRFLYGTKEDGAYVNWSKQEWQKLTSWQKFIVAFVVFFSYFWAVITVYLRLV